MTYTQTEISRIISDRCLPEEYREDVEEILAITDPSERLEELNVMTAHCYRFEPNHPRYDRNRAMFPRFEDEWVAPKAA